MEIGKIHCWAKDGKEKALKHYNRTFASANYDLAIKYKKRYEAFSLIKEGAELILKTDTGAIVKDAPLRKRGDGGSTDIEGTATLEAPAGADFNEVRADGGNKQTQELEFRCGEADNHCNCTSPDQCGYLHCVWKF